jgi:hypothetical protein
MQHEELKALLPFVALDQLTDEQRRAVAEHLASGCSECEAMLQKLRVALAEARKPDRRIRALVALWQVTTALALAAAAIIAIAMGDRVMQLDNAAIANARRIAALEVRVKNLQGQLQEREKELATARIELSREQQLTAVALEPDSHLIQLAPYRPTESARGLIALSVTNRRAVMGIAGLPPAPDGKFYEAWWITRDGRSVKAAVLNIREDRLPMIVNLHLPPRGEPVRKALVTLEVQSGVSRPGKQVYLAGTL